MGNITLSLPEDVHQDMKQFPEVKWSEVARRAIIEKMEMLRLAEKIASKSKLTEKDAEELTRKVKKAANKRFLEQLSTRT